jgi:hypothetical protein
MAAETVGTYTFTPAARSIFSASGGKKGKGSKSSKSKGK